MYLTHVIQREWMTIALNSVAIVNDRLRPTSKLGYLSFKHFEDMGKWPCLGSYENAWKVTLSFIYVMS